MSYFRTPNSQIQIPAQRLHGFLNTDTPQSATILPGAKAVQAPAWGLWQKQQPTTPITVKVVERPLPPRAINQGRGYLLINSNLDYRDAPSQLLVALNSPKNYNDTTNAVPITQQWLLSVPMDIRAALFLAALHRSLEMFKISGIFRFKLAMLGSIPITPEEITLPVPQSLVRVHNREHDQTLFVRAFVRECSPVLSDRRLMSDFKTAEQLQAALKEIMKVNALHRKCSDMVKNKTAPIGISRDDIKGREGLKKNQSMLQLKTNFLSPQVGIQKTSHRDKTVRGLGLEMNNSGSSEQLIFNPKLHLKAAHSKLNQSNEKLSTNPTTSGSPYVAQESKGRVTGGINSARLNSSASTMNTVHNQESFCSSRLVKLKNAPSKAFQENIAFSQTSMPSQNYDEESQFLPSTEPSSPTRAFKRSSPFKKSGLQYESRERSQINPPAPVVIQPKLQRKKTLGNSLIIQPTPRQENIQTVLKVNSIGCIDEPSAIASTSASISACYDISSKRKPVYVQGGDAIDTHPLVSTKLITAEALSANSLTSLYNGQRDRTQTNFIQYSVEPINISKDLFSEKTQRVVSPTVRRHQMAFMDKAQHCCCLNPNPSSMLSLEGSLAITCRCPVHEVVTVPPASIQTYQPSYSRLEGNKKPNKSPVQVKGLGFSDETQDGMEVQRKNTRLGQRMVEDIILSPSSPGLRSRYKSSSQLQMPLGSARPSKQGKKVTPSNNILSKATNIISAQRHSPFKQKSSSDDDQTVHPNKLRVNQKVSHRMHDFPSFSEPLGQSPTRSAVHSPSKMLKKGPLGVSSIQELHNELDMLFGESSSPHRKSQTHGNSDYYKAGVSNSKTNLTCEEGSFSYLEAMSDLLQRD